MVLVIILNAKIEARLKKGTEREGQLVRWAVCWLAFN